MSDTANLVDKFRTMYTEDPARFDDLPGSNYNWRPMKLVQLYSMIEEGDRTHGEMADILGFERSTVTRKTNSINWDDFRDRLIKLCSMSHDEYIEYSADDYRTKALAREALRRRKIEVSSAAKMQHLEQMLIDSAEPIKVSKLPPIKVPKAREGTPEHMCLLLSDLHVGQEFSQEETGGFGEYNIEVFKERANSLRRGVIEIASLHSQLYELPELHIFALGDNVHGGNSAGNWGCAYNSSLSVMDQANVAAHVIAQMINTWAPMFKKINFYGVVGNHGRINAMKNSDKIQANFDNVVYSILKGIMSNSESVEINFFKHWFARVSVFNTEIVLVHGDYLKKSVNAMLQTEQKIQSLMMTEGSKPFNLLCAGHFHTFQDIETTNGRIFLNGSFVGGDMYSMRQLSTRSRPTQTVFGIHPKRGVTWEYKLDLDGDRS